MKTSMTCYHIAYYVLKVFKKEMGLKTLLDKVIEYKPSFLLIGSHHYVQVKEQNSVHKSKGLKKLLSLSLTGLLTEKKPFFVAFRGWFRAFGHQACGPFISEVNLSYWCSSSKGLCESTKETIPLVRLACSGAGFNWGLGHFWRFHGISGPGGIVKWASELEGKSCVRFLRHIEFNS